MRAKNNILEGVWILFPILIFASYLLYRLYDQSAVLFFFPLDYSNDLSSVMAQLYFLAEYGFHAIIPHWYNGSFQLFQFYYPGWFYFALPLYWLTSNVQYAWYMALILVYLLAFLSLIIFRKTFGLSRTEASLFFLVFFANPLSIGNFIRLGRTVEFFSWFLFLSLSLLLFYYRGRSFDRYILLFIPLFTLLLLSHPTVLILFGFVLLSFLLTKPMREKIVLILLGFVSFIFSSFWFVPYLLNISKGSILSTYHLNTDSLFFFSGGWLFLNLVWAVFALSFLLLFYSYWKQKRFSYHELLFFSPVLFIAFLFLSRLVFFIPGLQQIFPDTYTLFFLFFSLYLLFNIKVDFYPLFFRRFFPIFFTLLAVFSVVC
ncbi:hypothetical protein J4430_03535 [Candidatus Woesearchaeota archaeon]|nr:hypothetical protein [Candidatus Woesearchaeota archaeon]